MGRCREINNSELIKKNVTLRLDMCGHDILFVLISKGVAFGCLKSIADLFPYQPNPFLFTFPLLSLAFTR